MSVNIVAEFRDFHIKRYWVSTYQFRTKCIVWNFPVVISDITYCVSLFQEKNEVNRLAVSRFSNFPDAINKSIVPSTSLNVQLVAAFLSIPSNMVSASVLFFLLRSLIIVSRTIFSKLFIFSAIFSQSKYTSQGYWTILVFGLFSCFLAFGLFLFCHVLMKMISRL